MKILVRTVAVILVLVALFLIGAVINALLSAGGAKAGVAVLYIAIAVVSVFAARWLWFVRGAAA